MGSVKWLTRQIFDFFFFMLKSVVTLASRINLPPSTLTLSIALVRSCTLLYKAYEMYLYQ